MGGIMTKNAKDILDIINSSRFHLTAEEIYQSLKEKHKTVVLATVYNNLSFLHEQGLVRRISVAGYSDRYDNVTRHDHLLCEKCGKLTDVRLEDMRENLQKQTRISILSYDLRINYICDECSKDVTVQTGH